MKPLNTFLLGVVLLALCACAKQSHRQQRLHAFSAEDTPSGAEVVLVGDSLAEGCPWPGLRNRGIGGDATGDVLARLDASVGGSRTVILWCGINDLLRGQAVEQAASGYARIVAGLRNRGVRVVIVPVLAPNAAKYAQVIAPIYKRNHEPSAEAVAALNDFIRRLQVERVDVSLVVDEAGRIRAEFTDDGLHLNRDGYDRIQPPI